MCLSTYFIFDSPVLQSSERRITVFVKKIPLVQSNFIAEIKRAVLQIVLQITYTNCTAKWRNFQNFAKKQGNSEESAMVSKWFKSPLKFK